MTAMRVPPHSLDAERAVLGGVMLDNAAIDEVTAMLPDPAAFYAAQNGVTWAAMLRLSARSEAIDLVTLRRELLAHGDLARAGGDEALIALNESPPPVANIEHHARIVRDLASVRAVILTLSKLTAEGYGGEIEDPREWCISAEAAIAAAVAQSTEAAGPASLKDCVIETVEHITAIEESRKTGEVIAGAPIPIGFAALDRMLGTGLRGGQLVVIAGRPGMGKTAFALNAALNMTHGGAPGAIFSLEMSKLELGQRLISSEARVDSDRMRTGKLSREDWQRVQNASGALASLELAIDDTASAHIAYIRATCRRLHARGKLAYVVVDYLQLMRSTTRGANQNRESEVAEISRGFKLLAKELNVPVLLLSQLNRSLESRADKRPMLADLRESGAIEQDADVVVFLYREELYARDNPQVHGTAEAIVAKQRSGPTGTAHLRYFHEYTRFDALAEDDDSQPFGTSFRAKPDNEFDDDNWRERYP